MIEPKTFKFEMTTLVCIDAKGSQAKGSQSKGSQAKGSQAKGSQD